ncbi:unnamed protein product [Caenorhabditis auriculariae]|uniref:C-type lectin domain-containing protein n=1 Tax=Caenorhabditis auriculariae TaxID=2777116 RepID=A0A8S1HPH2_9PELO|nr:unnamed protein product [Caenorhabditis auriculariae]
MKLCIFSFIKRAFDLEQHINVPDDLSFFLCLPATLIAKSADGQKLVCPDKTWKMFERTGNRLWCIQYNDGNVNRAAAEKVCREHGGTLTGFENEEEFVYIRDTALKEFKKFNLPKGGGYWLDGIRSPNCYGPDNNGCNRLTAFQWSNNLTQGTFAFTKWSDLFWEPNNGVVDGEYENCLQGLLTYEAPHLNGAINDFQCSRKDTATDVLPYYTIYGFFCGTSAGPPKLENPNKSATNDCSTEEEPDCEEEEAEDCSPEEEKKTHSRGA